jgi:hypothetical protein
VLHGGSSSAAIQFYSRDVKSKDERENGKGKGEKCRVTDGRTFNVSLELKALEDDKLCYKLLLSRDYYSAFSRAL